MTHLLSTPQRSLPADTRQPLPPLDELRSLVEGATDLLTLVDAEGRILYDNPVVEPLLGYRQGELVGRSAFALIHPGDYPAAVSLLAELATGTRTTGTLRFRFRRASGGWVPLESRGRVIAGPDGTPRVVVTSRRVDGRGDATAEGSAPRRELEEARVEVVERLARAAEFRDDDTGLHQRRVGELAAALAERVGLARATVEVVRRAAPLHDVGKIGIPDAILLKPGPLLPDEEEVMRTHPVLGARILGGGSTALVRAAEEIALSHHERWDGWGYPRGLAQRRISVLARIVAIADVFDALSHPRPYRPAWEPARVRAFVEEESGTRFDPALARAFLEMIA
jgi:PAS domain S-box-containing protein